MDAVAFSTCKLCASLPSGPVDTLPAGLDRLRDSKTQRLKTCPRCGAWYSSDPGYDPGDYHYDEDVLILQGIDPASLDREPPSFRRLLPLEVRAMLAAPDEKRAFEQAYPRLLQDLRRLLDAPLAGHVRAFAVDVLVEEALLSGSAAGLRALRRHASEEVRNEVERALARVRATSPAQRSDADRFARMREAAERLASE